MSDPYNSFGDKAGPKNVAKLPVTKRAPPSDNWYRVRKIARMAGFNPRVRVDPVQVAASTLEKARAGKIKSVFVSIQWDDDSIACDWSQMKSSSLIAHAYNVQSTVQEEVHKP